MKTLRLTLVASLLCSSVPALALDKGLTPAILVPTAAVARPGVEAALPQLPAALPATLSVEGAAAQIPVGAMPQLDAIAAPEAGEPMGAAPSGAGDSYDGAVTRTGAIEPSRPILEPAFEPPRFRGAPPKLPPTGGGNGGGRKEGPEERRLSVSFPPAALGGLMAVDPAKSIYGIVKTVRAFEASKTYWSQFKKGAELDVKSRGEDVFGRPTTITWAGTKTIGKLTRDDLEGVFTVAQLKAPIKDLRNFLVEKLEDARKVWQSNDPVITLQSTVRVMRFKSFLDLYREKNGKDAVPEPEPVQPRLPLSVKAEGRLEALSLALPRAVFLDVDAFDGPVKPELLSDMMKLQRTGVYFVAFSRKPYSAPGGMKEKLTHGMSAYQLSILMPIRFLAVTDDGAVISVFPKGGNVVPVDVASFPDAQMEVLRDAAQKASEVAGIPPRSVKEVPQLSIKERVDEFPGMKRREAAKLRDPNIRYELAFPKDVNAAQFHVWMTEFDRRLKSQGLEAKATLNEDGKKGRRLAVQRADFGNSLKRVYDALGDQFGLYLDAGDMVVLSDDKALRQANPGLDLHDLTGLKGEALMENALGLMLGEHRQNVTGDLSGSASRMMSFTRDRTRYMSEFLVKQDGMEQNINFFSGHVVHAAMDWLIWHLKNGRKPTPAEFEAHVRERWDAGLREHKAIGLPPGEDMEGWMRESVRRGLSMYKMVVKISDRGEKLIGTEIPTFFMLKDFQRRSSELKRRYVVHAILDFVALRPDPKKPGHATLVIYDFKTGPAQSRQKLDKDLQVLTYALMARQKWVGKRFPTPYLSGAEGYVIDDVSLEFIYNAIKQPTTVTAWDLQKVRRKIIGTLNRIRAAEAKMLGEDPAPKPKKARSPKKK